MLKNLNCIDPVVKENRQKIHKYLMGKKSRSKDSGSYFTITTCIMWNKGYDHATMYDIIQREIADLESFYNDPIADDYDREYCTVRLKFYYAFKKWYERSIHAEQDKTNF